ncbi:MAG: PaaI family thioesterase [Deltaproteobacteria bacterium]|nr:PaaI family thioesterase [Deltaproteobacteria bacterium]MBW2447690.1 PaaI family thioesterase [Deltaproteobacteria bacterium]
MTEAPRDWRAPALPVVEELRELSKALAVNTLDPDALAQAAALVREARALLDGPPRTRWYDRGGATLEIDEETARAYFEQSPIRGSLNPVAPPLTVEPGEREDGTPVMVGHAHLGMAYEGPPHGVHGGWVAALFDDILGASQWLAGTRGVTARLEVQYRHVTPLEEDLRFEAWIESQKGRRIVAKATCHAGDTLTAEAEALFLKVDFRQVQQKMKTRKGKPGGS